MPRKKAAAELVQPEELDQSSQQKVRQVKHKTEWVELQSVGEASEEVELDLADDEAVEEKPKRRVNNERDELRKKLAKNNVTPASPLKLTIEKYPHSDAVDGEGGVFADTAHCAKYVCTESHITSEDYLDVARKFGPGLYRFTLRMKNQIVTAWDKRINAAPGGPVIQHTNPNDPNSPQVIVNMPEGSGQQTPTIDPFKEAERALSLVEKYNRAFGRLQPQTAENPARSEEEIIASAIIKQPAMIESVVESIVKRVGGKGGSGDDEPWFAGILKDSITTGQLAPTVQAIVKGLFPNGLFGGFNNGQTQVGNPQQPVNHAPGGAVENIQNQMHQITGEQHGAGLPPTQANEQAPIQGHNETNHAAPAQITPTDQALNTLLSDCRMKLPPEIAYGKLMDFADAVYDEAPAYSIYPYIKYLGDAPTDTVIEYVKTLPGGAQIAELPHAKEWTAEFQRLIKESQEGDES